MKFRHAIIVLGLITAPAAAQEEALPASVTEPYLAWETAMQTQDYRAALEAAEEAWRAAEREAIDRELIGVLAANYGELALALGAFETGAEAWSQAAEIADRVGAAPAELAYRWHKAAMAAYLNQEISDALDWSQNAEAALEKGGADGLPREILGGHYHLAARAALGVGRYRSAADFAEAGLNLLETEGASAGDSLIADLYFTRGLGDLIDRRYEDSIWSFDAAERLYRDLDAQDEVRIAKALRLLPWGRLDEEARWRYVQRRQASDHALEEFWDEGERDGGLRRARFTSYLDAPERWMRRQREAGSRGHVEALFDISERGRARNIRIVSNELDDEAGRLLRDHIERWRFGDFENGVPGGAEQDVRYRLFFQSGIAVTSGYDSDRIARIGPVSRVEPRYPSRAAERGLSGIAVVGYDIAEDGSTENVEVLFSMPPGVFEETSLEAVRRWRYAVTDAATAEDREGLSTQFRFELAD